MLSKLHQQRLQHTPQLPKQLLTPFNITIQSGSPTESVSDQKEIKEIFPLTYGLPSLTYQSEPCKLPCDPLKVGIILSGGPAPGGHNVICGLYDSLISHNSKSSLLGFIGGITGLLKNNYREIDSTLLETYRNSGGFDIIGSGRAKVDKPEDYEKAFEVVTKLELNGLIIVGGDDSNTNAALLSEFFLKKNSKTIVVGIPKTIDGDLKNEHIEMSFGFHTATSVYSELVGNIQRDAISSLKYYHFIKVMGRSASHIAIEVALNTQPNLVIISEEVENKQMTISQVTNMVVDVIEKKEQKKI